PWASGSTAVAQPVVGQAGKDVVWVPTPPELVEEMLDLARVTPGDFVIDLGSGDGRNVIAAAKRGARSLGVEYNADLVELSRKSATAAGVAERAQFVQGDMYEADISQATVLALFLVPENLLKLRPKFLALPPGTRIVSNTFGIEGWKPDQESSLPGCNTWCSALLWVVPARVEGRWTSSGATLQLQQSYQMVAGTVTTGNAATPITQGQIQGSRVTLVAGEARYDGVLVDHRLEGTVTVGDVSSPWTATRVQ
ncbi:MAG: class I SAM-dependent methyltransferase, partial [Vicinamibacterales bacterium]